MRSFVLAAAAFAAFQTVPASAAVIDLDTLGGWDVIDEVIGVGNFFTNSWTTALGTQVLITDLFVWGDEYEYFVDGVSQGLILAPLPPAPFDPDPDSAYAGGLFARTSFFLPAGSVLTIRSITLPVGFNDATVAVRGVIPEPATWGLMIAGFGLVGAALRRRTALAA